MTDDVTLSQKGQGRDPIIFELQTELGVFETGVLILGHSVCICLYESVCLVRVVLDVAAFERVLGNCMDIMKRNIDAYEEQLVNIFGSRAAITDLR